MIDGQTVAPAEIAAGRRERGRGLLGRDGVAGALVIEPASSVHTVGMRFAIDVALCRWASPQRRTLAVVAMRTLGPRRATMPRPRARVVIEAEAGAFAAWGLRPGTLVHLQRQLPNRT